MDVSCLFIEVHLLSSAQGLHDSLLTVGEVYWFPSFQLAYKKADEEFFDGLCHLCVFDYEANVG